MEDSIARAVATAGGAVVFAGATVIIALAALAVTGIPFLAVMGLAAAATVALAVLVAVSLVPAALGFLGERLRPRARPTEGREHTPDAWGLAWARAVTRKPLLVLLAGVIGLLALAVPARDLRLGKSTSMPKSVAPNETRLPAANASMGPILVVNVVESAES